MSQERLGEGMFQAHQEQAQRKKGVTEDNALGEVQLLGVAEIQVPGGGMEQSIARGCQVQIKEALNVI